MKLSNSRLKGFDEVILVFVSLCMFMLFFLGKRGIIYDFVLLGLVIGGIYFIANIELALPLVIYAGAIKATPINVLPKFADMTLLFYLLLVLGIALHILFNKKRFFQFFTFDMVMVFMLASVGLAFFNTPADVYKFGLEKFLRFALLAFPFFYIPRFFDDESLRKIIRFFAISGAVFSAAVFMLYADFVQMIHSGVNYLSVAKMAGISFIFNFYLFIKEKGVLKKSLFMLFMLVSLLLLFKANSRGGILFLLASMLVYSWFILKDKKIYFIVLIAAVLGGVLVIMTVSPDSFRRFSLLFGRHKGFSVSERFTMYLLSLKLISRYWFTGVGLGGFAKYHYLKWPHNIFLEFFVECGLAGFITVVLFYFYLGLKAFKLIFRFKLSNDYTPFILSFVFLALYHLSSFSLMDLRWLFFFAGFVFIFEQRAINGKKQGKQGE